MVHYTLVELPEAVDLVDQVVLERLVLARHVRGHGEGRGLLLLVVLLQRLHLRVVMGVEGRGKSIQKCIIDNI